jgi:hypothetical protein
MAGSFPTEFPQQGISALTKMLFGGTGITGEAALGAYDIVGFGLFQIYGDVHYTMQSDTPGHIANAMAQAPPEVQKFLDFSNSNPELLKGELPVWLVPFLQQLAQVVLEKLFERLSQQENPKLFGLNLKRSLPRETGGAFPERKIGIPSGTGAFTTSRTLSESQASGAQSQPSDKMQQPTGHVPEKHTSVPQSSKSPQLQANTADSENKIPIAGSPSSQSGSPVTNAPGVSGTPGTTVPPQVPKPSPQPVIPGGSVPAPEKK